VIEQQADLHRLLVQIRNRELLDPVLDDCSRNRQRVDLNGLARLALALAGGAHPVRSNPDHALARRQQRLLKAPRDMPAVLDRPHPLLVEASRPPHRRQMPRLIGLDLPLATNPAGSLDHRRQRVGALCVSAPITIICTVPWFG
jgi:hypothetical protein